jgi:hypothetical protein
MQAGAALAPGVGQQAFKHAAGFRVAGVIPARAHQLVKSQSRARASATSSTSVTGWRGGQSASGESARSTLVLGFVIVAMR